MKKTHFQRRKIREKIYRKSEAAKPNNQYTLKHWNRSKYIIQKKERNNIDLYIHMYICVYVLQLLGFSMCVSHTKVLRIMWKDDKEETHSQRETKWEKEE